MKIGDKDDKPNTGRIHCDYATARDDMHEWESMQRAIAREQRHQQRILEDMNRPPSPPQIVGYSENEAGKVTEMLKCEFDFQLPSIFMIRHYDFINCASDSLQMRVVFSCIYLQYGLKREKMR